MRILYEVGDTVAWRVYPDDATIQMDQPMRGWMKISQPGVLDSWFRLDRVIAVVPDDRLIAVDAVEAGREAMAQTGYPL